MSKSSAMTALAGAAAGALATALALGALPGLIRGLLPEAEASSQRDVRPTFPRLAPFREVPRRLEMYVVPTQPFPGATLIEAWVRMKDGTTPTFCHFLVRGEPERVLAKATKPEDVIQMSCQRNYVRTFGTNVFWD